MGINIVINGREVTTPVARMAIAVVAILFAGVLTAAVIFLILPLIGIVVTLSVGLVGVILVALGLGLPLVILGGTFLGACLTPFAVFRKKKQRDRNR